MSTGTPYPPLVHARLARRRSPDGFIEIEDHVPLGKLYTIDVVRLILVDGFNLVYARSWPERWYVWDVLGSWLPVELLDVIPAGR